jgi:hypothetical protein
MGRAPGEPTKFFGYVQFLAMIGTVILGIASLGILLFGTPTTERKSVFITFGISLFLWIVCNKITNWLSTKKFY